MSGRYSESELALFRQLLKENNERARLIAEKRYFKCPINDPDCKQNCGSYGCGN